MHGVALWVTAEGHPPCAKNPFVRSDAPVAPHRMASHQKARTFPMPAVEWSDATQPKPP